MKKILVTGSKGQLGNEIKSIAHQYQSLDFVFTDVEELDITNKGELNDFFTKHKFDFLINCAAYTAVDKAEEDQENAKKINIEAVVNLVEIGNQFNIGLIHISTDYVFDGKNYKPYVENDQPQSNSFYGYTKLEGEKWILKHSNDAIIVRTSWLYSSFGNNFVKTILKYAALKDELNVVWDQIGTPTYANDLACALAELIIQEKKKGVEIYHYSNEGVCSWYDFAKEIIQHSKHKCIIIPIEGKDFNAAANRPFYSVLNKSKIKKSLNIKIPYWKDSLIKCLSKLK